MQKVKQISLKTGDSKSLSEADMSIIAVSLDLVSDGSDVTLVTDDFAVRNVAEALGVGLSQTNVRGEWKQITWVTYCKGCGKEYSDPKMTTCGVCGTKLSRKPKS